MAAVRGKKNIAGIILAAGMSRRMGKPKQLLLFKGAPLLAHVLDAADATCLDPIIVVLGFRAEEIRHQMDFRGHRVVIAESFAQGQSASLKTGVSEVPAHCDGALFLLGDQPLITAGIIEKVLDTFHLSDRDIVIPTYGGRRGNPVLIGRRLFPQLYELTGDIGARALFKTHPNQIQEVQIPSKGACFDVDTLEDYRQLCQKTECPHL